MPADATLEKLFVHELKDLYYAERVLEEALGTLAKEADDPVLSEAFQHHRTETGEQIANLEEVFSLLGEKPAGEHCPGIDGIKQEHDAFMEEASPRGRAKDVFLTGAAARAESYEIAAYSGLVTLAKALGRDEAATLLGANLAQEREALQRMEIAARRLSEANGAKRSPRPTRRPAAKRAPARTGKRSTAKARK